MRLLAIFLLTYLLSASFAPALVCVPGTCETKVETACASRCGDKQQPCDTEEESACPLGACNVCPCCCYCFGFMTEEMNFRISRFENSQSRIIPSGENIRPAFPSDCWQPPEA